MNCNGFEGEVAEVEFVRALHSFTFVSVLLFVLPPPLPPSLSPLLFCHLSSSPLSTTQCLVLAKRLD